MKTILITGASGFIGSALADALAENYSVLCMSRQKPPKPHTWIPGNFASNTDLQKLDSYSIDCVVHLAAVTGGCSEHDGVIVNCEGTRALMRYLIDANCKKFVMASSIALVGMQNKLFRPLTLPIPDEHPCLDRDGYGFSKFLMEEVTKYYQRQNPSIDVINLRLSSVFSDEKPPELCTSGHIPEWALGRMTMMSLTDAVAAFSRAAHAEYSPGVRIMNAAAPVAWAAEPTADILRSWWNDDCDLSAFSQPGHEFDSVYDVQRISDELDFVAEHTVSLFNSLK